MAGQGPEPEPEPTQCNLKADIFTACALKVYENDWKGMSGQKVWHGQAAEPNQGVTTQALLEA